MFLLYPYQTPPTALVAHSSMVCPSLRIQVLTALTTLNSMQMPAPEYTAFIIVD